MAAADIWTWVPNLMFATVATWIAMSAPPDSGVFLMRLPRLWDSARLIAAIASGFSAVLFAVLTTTLEGSLVPLSLGALVATSLIFGGTCRGNSIRTGGLVDGRVGFVPWADIRKVHSAPRSDGLHDLAVAAQIPRPRAPQVLWFLPPHTDLCTVELSFALSTSATEEAEQLIREWTRSASSY